MGTSTRDWMPWIKRELGKKKIKVYIPDMPNTEEPEVDKWIEHISKVVGKPDKNTILIGHSLGGNAILRYLQQMKSGQKVGAAIIVASWLNRRKGKFRTPARRKMMSPWFKTPLYFNRIAKHSESFTALYSDDDRYVPKSAAQILKKKLGAKRIIAHHQLHFDQTKNLFVLKEILYSVDKIKAGKSGKSYKP